MKLKFDPNQTYQKDAIQSGIDVFEDQPLNKGIFEISFRVNAGVFQNLQRFYVG